MPDYGKYVGESLKRSDQVRQQYSNKKGFSTGGRVKSYPHMTAGAVTGEGRLQKIDQYGANARKK